MGNGNGGEVVGEDKWTMQGGIFLIWVLLTLLSNWFGLLFVLGIFKI